MYENRIEKCKHAREILKESTRLLGKARELYRERKDEEAAEVMEMAYAKRAESQAQFTIVT